jgi:hypothetical protein
MANLENRLIPGLNWMRWAALLSILLVLLSSCGANPLATQTDQTPDEKTPAVFGGQDAKAAVEHFLQLWKMEDYPGMFAQLTGLSQDATTLEDFEERYRETAAVLGLQAIDPAVLSVLQNGNSAQVSYRVIYHTSLFGDLKRDLVVNIIYEGKAWRIQWEEGMILPELSLSLIHI